MDTELMSSLENIETENIDTKNSEQILNERLEKEIKEMITQHES